MVREYFGVEEKNKTIVSRIIEDVVDAGFIILSDGNAAPKLRRHIPYWVSILVDELRLNTSVREDLYEYLRS